MSRPKGTPKTGGRTKGTQNKVSMQVKDWLSKLIYKNRETLEEDLRSLESKDRLAMIEKFMSYCVPKLQAQTIDVQQQVEPEQKMTLEEIQAEIARLDDLEARANNHYH